MRTFDALLWGTVIICSGAALAIFGAIIRDAWIARRNPWREGD